MLISNKKNLSAKKLHSSTILGGTYLQSLSIYEAVQEPELGTHFWTCRATEPVHLEKPVRSFDGSWYSVEELRSGQTFMHVTSPPNCPWVRSTGEYVASRWHSASSDSSTLKHFHIVSELKCFMKVDFGYTSIDQQYRLQGKIQSKTQCLLPWPSNSWTSQIARLCAQYSFLFHWIAWPWNMGIATQI
jgi:hypothetical protein